jgi:murein DD-endopeptidase MepM/ murein hydrolase activator NlpD
MRVATATMLLLIMVYSYETLYGHMVRIKVHVGEQIKRGEVIGMGR